MTLCAMRWIRDETARNKSKDRTSAVLLGVVRCHEMDVLIEGRGISLDHFALNDRLELLVDFTDRLIRGGNELFLPPAAGY